MACRGWSRCDRRRFERVRGLWSVWREVDEWGVNASGTRRKRAVGRGSDDGKTFCGRLDRLEPHDVCVLAVVIEIHCGLFLNIFSRLCGVYNAAQMMSCPQIFSSCSCACACSHSFF